MKANRLRQAGRIGGAKPEDRPKAGSHCTENDRAPRSSQEPERPFIEKTLKSLFLDNLFADLFRHSVKQKRVTASIRIDMQ
jgi:hypothetical protein